jgi:hypothetical protein
MTRLPSLKPQDALCWWKRRRQASATLFLCSSTSNWTGFSSSGSAIGLLVGEERHHGKGASELSELACVNPGQSFDVPSKHGREWSAGNEGR